MAHLADGVLALPVVIGGGALAVLAVGQGLRRIEPEHLPRVAVLAAAFFVASLVHVPIGPSSVHLLLNGLLGIVLGWAAMPAVFVALLLQAVFFGFGGITVLGVNTLILGLPAVMCSYLFASRLRQARRPWVWGAAAGATSVLLTCAGVASALALSGKAFLPAAQLVLVAHLPVMVVEAVITALAVGFLRRVKPAVLSFPRALARPAHG